MITDNLSTLDIYRLTEEQFKRRVDNDNIDDNALYLTDDEATLTVTADEETMIASHTS